MYGEDVCQKSKENIYFPRSYEQKEFEKNIRVMGFLGRKKNLKDMKISCTWEE